MRVGTMVIKAIATAVRWGDADEYVETKLQVVGHPSNVSPKHCQP